MKKGQSEAERWRKVALRWKRIALRFERIAEMAVAGDPAERALERVNRRLVIQSTRKNRRS